MQAHRLVPDGEPLRPVVHAGMRKAGVSGEDLRRALQNLARELVQDAEVRTFCVHLAALRAEVTYKRSHLVEGAVHEASARAAAHQRGALAEHILWLAVVSRDLQRWLARGEDLLQAGVDGPPPAVGHAEV